MCIVLYLFKSDGGNVLSQSYKDRTCLAKLSSAFANKVILKVYTTIIG